MNKKFTLAMLILLTACDASDWASEVPESCIPPEYRVAAPWWVPGEPHFKESGGAAFAGCWNNKTIENCVLPPSISGGGISWEGKAPAKTLGQKPPDAFYPQMTLDPESAIERNETEGVLIVSNPSLSDNWLIWKPQSGLVSDQVSESDELLAVCKYVDVLGVSPEEIFCERFVEGNGYYAQITFWSLTRVPTDLDSLDRDLLRVLDAWGCGTSRGR